MISYLTGPVISTISVLAGHLKNTFVMRRGRVPDHPELLAMVFPEVPELLLEMTQVWDLVHSSISYSGFG